MPKRQWRRTFRQLRSMQVWRTRLVFWTGAVLVGVISVALALASDWAGQGFRWLTGDRSWLPFLLSPLGLVLITWSTRRWFPASAGSGIPQAIAMLQVPDESIRRDVLGLGTGLFKGAMICLGLLCGASIGREGPTVHIGAAIAYSLSQVKSARFPHHALNRGLIMAGAAAGLSAAFNTPLAGIVFAIEEMSRDFETRTNGVVLTAVIGAGMTALALQGNYSYFGMVETDLEPLEGIAAVLVCGILGGALGGLFSILMIRGSAGLAPLRNAHPYSVALVCGLLLAAIGLASGGVTFGTGYEEAQRLLGGGEGMGPLNPLLKLMATLASYLSGIPGGIFAPTLGAGASLGAELAPLLPFAPAVAVTLLGMTAYFTGVVQSPITSVVIIMEMTGDQTLLLPLMATALLAEWVSRHICPRPLYRALADNFLKGLPGPAPRP